MCFLSTSNLYSVNDQLRLAQQFIYFSDSLKYIATNWQKDMKSVLIPNYDSTAKISLTDHLLLGTMLRAEDIRMDTNMVSSC